METQARRDLSRVSARDISRSRMCFASCPMTGLEQKIGSKLVTSSNFSRIILNDLYNLPDLCLTRHLKLAHSDIP